MLMLDKVGPTVTVAVPLIVPTVACIVAVPGSTPVTIPFGAVLLTVAAPVGLLVETDHVADPVKSLVELSSYVPVATKVPVAPTPTVEVAGVTAMEVSLGSVKKSLQPAPIRIKATNASSAGQALRFGKNFIGTSGVGGRNSDRAGCAKF
jgi:hypothetical protein